MMTVSLTLRPWVQWFVYRTVDHLPFSRTLRKSS